jgi:YegS/Rv2252/BmrU family lipid kinase
VPAAVVPIILNARAGQGHASEVATRLVEAFAQHGVAAEVHAASSGEEITQLARKALEQRPEILVAAGGDGTVSAVASCVKGSGTAMAVLPMGTLNHFARDLGMPDEMDAAVAAIARGQRRGVDVGEVNDRIFVNNASLGIYPDIVRDRTRQQRRLGRGKYWAMVWATIAVLRRSPFLKLELEIDGQQTHCRSPFVFIGNNDYVMEGFDIGKRSSLRDGRLSIYTTRRHTRWGLVRLALRALFGRLSQDADFAAMGATRLRIDTHRRRLLVATDGEVSAMDTPLEFRVLPGALDVIVPAA